VSRRLCGGFGEIQMPLDNRRRATTRLASQITAHSGFSPRSLWQIGIENIVRRWLRRRSMPVKPSDSQTNKKGLRRRMVEAMGFELHRLRSHNHRLLLHRLLCRFPARRPFAPNLQNGHKPSQKRRSSARSPRPGGFIRGLYRLRGSAMECALLRRFESFLWLQVLFTLR